MQKRNLGFTDLQLTVVGLGTWAIGGPWLFGWGKQDDDDSIRTIFEAADNGINWIDTAPIYGHGRSETVVGKALKEFSDKPYIATKCGLLWDRNNERIPCLKPDSIRMECEDSLKRLGVDVIDLYQIHWPISTAEAVEAWGEIGRLIKQGKVRYGGVSNFAVEQLEACQAVHPIASLQPHYSMLVRDIEDEIMPFCKKNNIGIIPYSTMGRGLLTGKFSHQRLAQLSDGDHRKDNPMFQAPKFDRIMDFVDKLKLIAESNSMTLSQLAIVWVLQNSEITSAIVGARKPGQISETAKAGSLKISQQDIEKINELIVEYKL